MKKLNTTSANSTLLNIFITALAPIFWGTTYVVTTELLPDDKPLLASVIRVLPVGILLTLWAKKLPIYKNNPNFNKHIFLKILLLSFLNITCFQSLLFISAYRLTGGISASIGSIQPLIIVGLIAMSTKKSPKITTLLAILASIAGMALLLIKDLRIETLFELDMVGVLSAFLGAISMAVGMFLTKRWKPDVNNVTFTGWQLMFGGLMLLPLMLIFEGLPEQFSQTNLLGYGYLAIFGSLIAYSLWFRGIDKINTVSVSILGTLSPITATLIGWLYLGQSLTPIQSIGFIIVIISVIVVQISSLKTTKN